MSTAAVFLLDEMQYARYMETMSVETTVSRRGAGNLLSGLFSFSLTLFGANRKHDSID